MMITDKVLTKWLKNNWEEFGFLRRPPGVLLRIDRRKSIKANIQKLDSGVELHRQRDQLKALWKAMVGCAIVHLKSKDGREGKQHDDGDYGLDTLNEYFEKFSEFESFLFGSSDLYRDHLSHLFRVFLLGEYLLRNNAHCQIGFDDLRIGDDGKLGVTSTSEKEAMWCLMALTHDIGYPLQVFHDINSRLRDMVKLFDVELASIATANPLLDDHVVRVLASKVVQIPAGERFQTQVQSNTSGSFSVHWRATTMVYKAASSFSRRSCTSLRPTTACRTRRA
jgi:hypothetical protein